MRGKLCKHIFIYVVIGKICESSYYVHSHTLTIGTSGSIVVCISQLTSMMMDQRAKYTPRGTQAEFLGEAQTDPAIKDKVLREVQLVFITPESIISSSAYRKMLMSAVYIEKLVAVVVDEAHCVKTWGDQFRTTLAQIGDLQSHSQYHKHTGIDSNGYIRNFVRCKMQTFNGQTHPHTLASLQRQYKISSSFY